MEATMGASDKEFQAYLKEAKSWETDKVIEANKSKSLAWIIAGVAAVVAVIAVTSTALVATREPAPPVVLRVDNTTGIVDVVNTLTNGKTNYDEAVNKYFTQLYVRYREGFSYDLKEEYYNNVGLMSVGLEQQRFFESFNPKNPLSPINVYGQTANVKILNKGTVFIKPNIALVRFIKKLERANTKAEISHWTATITFRYVGAPMKQKDRDINPLGFQVTEYRVDPDSPGPEATAQMSPVPGADAIAPATSQPVAPVATATTAPIVPAIQPKQ
jgi:type IV secretion system protein VirB8